MVESEFPRDATFASGTFRAPGRSAAMSDSARVFVFVCGWSEYLGLSLDKTGANLPAFISSPHKWTRIDDVADSSDGLGTLNIDTNTTLENLKARGYHIALPSAKVLEFTAPQKARY
jgi:hypothetical protein